MYDYGTGVTQDKQQAVYWYRKAAEQGHAGAQGNLAWMYQFGEGVAQDDEQAIYWYRKSAEQGNTISQSNLDKMLDNGVSVTQDYNPHSGSNRRNRDRRESWHKPDNSGHTPSNPRKK
jgi:TPR repeat protein